MEENITKPALALAYVNPIPWLPLKLDAKRGSDRIRARIYCDSRIPSGLPFAVAIALSEFVSGPKNMAHPKQEKLAGMVHASRARVSNALGLLVRLHVLTTERKRTFKEYVFLESWVSAPVLESRCAETAHQDVPKQHITGEPVQGNRTGSDEIDEVRTGGSTGDLFAGETEAQREASIIRAESQLRAGSA